MFSPFSKRKEIKINTADPKFILVDAIPTAQEAVAMRNRKELTREDIGEAIRKVAKVQNYEIFRNSYLVDDIGTELLQKGYEVIENSNGDIHIRWAIGK